MTSARSYELEAPPFCATVKPRLRSAKPCVRSARVARPPSAGNGSSVIAAATSTSNGTPAATDRVHDVALLLAHDGSRLDGPSFFPCPTFMWSSPSPRSSTSSLCTHRGSSTTCCSVPQAERSSTLHKAGFRSSPDAYPCFTPGDRR